MTLLTKTLASTAIAVAFIGAPALAGDHNSTMSADAKAEMKAEKKMLMKENKRLEKEHNMMVKDADKTLTRAHIEAHTEARADIKDVKTELTAAGDADVSDIAGDNYTDDEDYVGQVLQTDNFAGEDSPGAEVIMHDGDIEDKPVVKAKDDDGMIADNVIVVPTLESDTVTTVTCPPRTEAQSNMTCLITGEFDYEELE